MTERATTPPTEELVLEPPAAVPAVSHAQADASITVDADTAQRIGAAVDVFVESLSRLDSKSPDFERKVQSITRMGHDEIRRSSEVSSRFLDRPTAALQRGPLTQGSQVSAALLSLRRQIEELDPSRHLSRRPRGLLRRMPLGGQVNDYFRRYQSAQSHIEAVVQGLYRGQDELMRDNAAIEQEKVHLWAMKERLEQYAYMAGALDKALVHKAQGLDAEDPEKARVLREDVLFYVRQKHQDILTQLAVSMQGYLSLDLIRRNNLELIKGVERATTTTVSALRTAVIASLALGSQKLVLDQITALNTTTGNLIESTSRMLRQQSTEIQNQAASGTIGIDKLQTAFANVYATMEAIDTFKLAALDTMKKTIDTLSQEVDRAQAYAERARSSEAAQIGAASLAEELALPAAKAS
ncbi:MAG: toxic anion resistance protein [Chloroflexota bacterium]